MQMNPIYERKFDFSHAKAEAIRGKENQNQGLLLASLIYEIKPVEVKPHTYKIQTVIYRSKKWIKYEPKDAISEHHSTCTHLFMEENYIIEIEISAVCF